MIDPTTPENAPPHINVDARARINFACQQNAVPILRTLSVENTGAAPLESLVLSLEATPGFMRPKTWTIDRIAAEGDVTLRDREISLDPAFLSGLNEAERGELRFRLTGRDGVIAEHKQPIEVLARDEWGGLADMDQILAAFVAPNDPAVAALMKDASRILQAGGHDPALNGYQTNDPTRAYMLAAAAWSAVSALGLTYAEPPKSFERIGQKVRDPGRIREEGLATCLDTSLLMAGLLEAIGLNPAMIFTAGHAFAGVWLTSCTFDRVAEPDVSALRKAMAAKEFIVFETTLLTHRPAGAFPHAVREGALRLREEVEHEFLQAVDVTRARAADIRPLAAHRTSAENALQEEVAAIPLPPPPDFGLLPGEMVEEASATPTGRIERWQRKLLDLSLRNRLLNFRDTAQTLPFHCTDVPGLEDRLADGAAMRVISLNAENPIGDRDPEMFMKETGVHIHDGFATAALDRKEVCVPLAEREMANRLTTLYRKAKSDMAEGGTNTLFLAAGFLRWKKRPEDARGYSAPLLLIPVKLTRKSAGADFRLSAHEDEARVNATLLQFLERDFGLRVPALDGELPRDQSGIDLPQIFTDMRAAVRDAPGFEVTEEVALSTFSFAKYLMWKDLVDRTDDLRSSRLVRHLIDTPDQPYPVSEGLVQAVDIDRRYSPGDLVTPLPADSSQLAAVAAVAEGEDLVIIGPPGTGKSQTIANMIAHCLSMEKTVLFVAEKSAALDVVHRRLKAHGLGEACLELHSSKADRKSVLAQLGAAWERSTISDASDWVAVNDKLRITRDQLNAYVAALHAPGRQGFSIFEAIGRIANGAKAPFFLRFKDADAHDDRSYRSLVERVEALASAHRAVDGVSGLQSISVTEWSHAWMDRLFEAARGLHRAALQLQDGVAALEVTLGYPAPQNPSLSRVALLETLAQTITRVAANDHLAAFNSDINALRGALTELEASISAFRQAESTIAATYAHEQLAEMPLSDIDRGWREANAKLWPFSAFAKRRVRTLLQSYASKGVANPSVDLAPLKMMKDRLADIAGSTLTGQPGFAGVKTDIQTLSTHFSDTEAFGKALAAFVRETGETAALAERLRSLLALRGDDETVRVARDLLAAKATFDAALLTYREMAGGAPLAEGIDDFCAELTALEDKRTQILDWTKWVIARQGADAAGLTPLIESLEAGEIRPEDASDAFQSAYAAWWAPLVLDRSDALRGFAHWEHEDRIAAFRDLDETAQSMAAEQTLRAIRHGLPVGDGVPRKSELGVLRHQLGLSRPSLAIRNLIAQMPESFAKLAPCVLMSPLSIAQYLPAGHAMFDVVIFDEASQITTWDAIGAIARGEQAVIVGDPRQLPPTNFFGRASSDEDEEIEDYEKDLPSILDEAASAGLPNRRLNWHYRSRDETLIAFSNHYYYGDGLVTFPSPSTGSSAVRFHKIDGVYARGAGRTNQAEAKAISALLVKRMTRELDREEAARDTFGVITFNTQQQSLVLDLLDEARRKNPSLEWYFEDAREEPTIVKNLENIQGDERDVMLFSITFGQDIAGKLSMAFGALNSEGGEKRLNVAVTRARSELHVFASLTADMIDLSRTRALGVRHLKAFLDYADRGPEALPETDEGSLGPAESPFEEAVADALRAKGWEVRTQIGVSGFRVDLGVVHPDKAGVYLAGVECDGATYHSSQNARDRDRTREAVLRGLGWEILQIWSTDWFTDPAKPLARVLAELESLLEQSRSEQSEEAFNHDANEDPDDRSEDPETGAPPSTLTPPDLPSPRAEQRSGEALQFAGNTAPYLAQRSDGDASADSAPLIPDQDRFFDLDYTPVLRDLIDKIILEEAPIRTDILPRKVAQIHGWGRAGRRIRDRTEACLGDIEIHDENDAPFIWRTGQHAQEIPWRGLNGRALREISRAEIIGLIRANPDLRTMEDPEKHLSSLAGLSRLTEESRRYLEDCVRLAERLAES